MTINIYNFYESIYEDDYVGVFIPKISGRDYEKENNKAYIEGLGYVTHVKTKTIIVESDGYINKIVGSMQ